MDRSAVIGWLLTVRQRAYSAIHANKGRTTKKGVQRYRGAMEDIRITNVILEYFTRYSDGKSRGRNKPADKQKKLLL
jgi:hypothetical protein